MAADPDAVDGLGNNSILRAILNGSGLHAVMGHVERGADINFSGCHYTPLCAAILVKNYEIVKYLIVNGADVNMACKFKNNTPLHFAAEMKYESEKAVKIINLLIDRGARESLNKNGDTPFLLSIQNGDPQIVDTFITRGADVNYGVPDNTPIHKACDYAKPGILELLLSKGADIKAAESGSIPPLILAICGKHTDGESLQLRLANILIHNGADVNLVAKATMPPVFENTSPLLCAAALGFLQIVELLLQNDASPTFKVPEGALIRFVNYHIRAPVFAIGGQPNPPSIVERAGRGQFIAKINEVILNKQRENEIRTVEEMAPTRRIPPSLVTKFLGGKLKYKKSKASKTRKNKKYNKNKKRHGTYQRK
jgi:ankyrin repeat protein